MRLAKRPIRRLARQRATRNLVRAVNYDDPYQTPHCNKFDAAYHVIKPVELVDKGVETTRPG